MACNDDDLFLVLPNYTLPLIIIHVTERECSWYNVYIRLVGLMCLLMVKNHRGYWRKRYWIWIYRISSWCCREFLDGRGKKPTFGDQKCQKRSALWVVKVKHIGGRVRFPYSVIKWGRLFAFLKNDIFFLLKDCKLFIVPSKNIINKSQPFPWSLYCTVRFVRYQGLVSAENC